MEQARELRKITEYVQELGTGTGAPQSNRMTDCSVDGPRKNTGSHHGEKPKLDPCFVTSRLYYVKVGFILITSMGTV